MTTSVYSYLKNITDSNDLMNYLKLNGLTTISSTNYNSSNQSLDLFFSSTLTIQQKAYLDSLISNYTPQVNIPFDQLSKYANYYNTETYNLTSGYQTIKFNGQNYINHEIYLNKDGYFKFTTTGNFIIYGFINITGGGQAILVYHMAGTDIPFECTRIYNNGFFFFPITNPTINDYVYIKAMSTTGGTIDFNSCHLCMVRSYVNNNYKFDAVFYSMLTDNTTPLTGTWTDVTFDRNLRNDAGYSVNGNVINIDNAASYLLFLKVATDTDLADLQVLVNDNVVPSLSTKTNTGIVSLFTTDTDNSTLKIQINGTNTTNMRGGNIMLLHLQASSSLNNYLSTIIRPKFLCTYLNTPGSITTNKFESLPSLTDTTRDTDIFPSGFTVESTGLYMLFFQMNSNDNVILKLLINNYKYMVMNSNSLFNILELETGDTLELECYNSNGTINYTSINLTLVRVEPEIVFQNANYSLFNSFDEIYNISSTEYISLVQIYSRKVKKGSYILKLSAEAITSIGNKSFYVNILVNNETIYENLLTTPIINKYPITLEIKKNIDFINDDNYSFIIQIKMVDEYISCMIKYLTLQLVPNNNFINLCSFS